MRNALVAAAMLPWFLGAEAAPVLENVYVRLAFDGRGRVESMREKVSGRELVKTPVPFVSIDAGRGAALVPTACAQEAGTNLVFTFAGAGEVVLSVAPFDGGWTFSVARTTVGGAREYRLGSFRPSCLAYRGDMVNAWSDEDSFVCTRIYDEGGSFRCADGLVEVRARPSVLPPVGVRFGVAAGPRPAAIPALRAMTLAAGVPHSGLGGAWALGAPDNRRSYWMAWGIGEFTADDEIELCRRGGFKTLHFDRIARYGDYTFKTNSLAKYFFPNRYDGLQAVLDKAHAAGLWADFHSLTACVARDSPWVTPECRDGLMTLATYTLARPLAADTNDATVVVNERPIREHEIVDSNMGRANFLKIGTEVMQYTGMSDKAPWTFTGVRRGACRTTVKAHAQGAKADYLFNSFTCFQVDADSELAKECWEVQGKMFERGFDSIYLDGVDCINVDPRKRDKFVRGIYAAALAKGRAPQYEDSQWTPSAWWFHSRIGACDHVHWDAKRSLDVRFDVIVKRARKANFLEPEMGWWAIQHHVGDGLPYRIDDHEYMGVRGAAADAAMSVLPDWGCAAFDDPRFEVHRYLTVLGWYERFRYARAFSDAAIADFRIPRSEYRLRQDPDGIWRYRPVEVFSHRIGGDRRAWRLESSAERPATIRVEALQKSCAFDAPEAATLVDPAKDAFEKASNKGVKVDFGKGLDPVHGETLKIAAENVSAGRKGAWSRVSRVWPRNGWADVNGRSALGVWVKGDGSGALLNVQLEAPRVYSRGIAEHYVRLDFSGWRYFEFSRLERDATPFHDYEWPYGLRGFHISYSLERVAVKFVQAVNFYLNDIPAGGKAQVEIGEVRTLVERKGVRYRDMAVTFNGGRLPVPFGLDVFEFAELEDGWWTRFSATGVPLERKPGPRVNLSSGANELSFDGESGTEGSPVRAQVSVLAFGGAKPALGEVFTEETRREIAYEAAEPERWAPSKGFSSLRDIVTRPGERAGVSFAVYGPIPPFSLSVNGERRQFPQLGRREYLACHDGESWEIRRRGADAGVTSKGRIAPFPPVAGRAPVALECERPGDAFAWIELAKHYRDWRETPREDCRAKAGPDEDATQVLALSRATNGLVAISSLPMACRPVETFPGRAPSLLPEGKEFRYVWGDEFDGTELDESKWGYRTNFWGRPAHWFAKPSDGCVEVRDGLLRLKVKKRADGQFVSPQLQTGELMWDVPPIKEPKGFWWLSKREKPRFTHRYGYYECRCRLQRKPGWWSAFWMQSEMQGACLDPGLAGIEHDVMESFDPGEIIVSAFHMNGYGPDYRSFHIPAEFDKSPRYTSRFNMAVDTETFHTFGLLWEPDGYSVYVDGRLRGRNGAAVSHIPEFILLSTECKWYRNDRMTGKGVPELEEAVAAGDDFVVDYVRVYEVTSQSKCD